jgi:hypothetical protein
VVLIGVRAVERPELPGRRGVGIVEAVATERVDVGVPDRGEAGERGVVGHEVGVRVRDVLERGGRVAGVPDEHGVDEQLQAEGVAVVIVLPEQEVSSASAHAAAYALDAVANSELALTPACRPSRARAGRTCRSSRRTISGAGCTLDGWEPR